MHFVTIPFDYEKLPGRRQAAIIPICIQRTDRDGRPIAWGWFEAAAKVQRRLRELARYVLSEDCRVSELAEGALHSLWYKHGDDLGRRPGQRVYKQAQWQAQDLKAGCWQSRQGTLVALDDVEQALRTRLTADPTDYSRVYQRKLDLDAVGERLARAGMEDASRVLDLLLDGCTWREVGERLGKDRYTARTEFWRSAERVLPHLKAKRQRPNGDLSILVHPDGDAGIMSDIDGRDSGTEV